jgi:hypothetical protein
MSSSKTEPRSPRAINVKVTRHALAVDLADGRTLVVPIDWYPRLLHGTPAERSGWRLVGRGEGIHWPALDEDISVRGLLAGTASGESASSIRRWLEGRVPRGKTGASLVRDRTSR